MGDDSSDRSNDRRYFFSRFSCVFIKVKQLDILCAGFGAAATTTLYAHNFSPCSSGSRKELVSLILLSSFCGI